MLAYRRSAMDDVLHKTQKTQLVRLGTLTDVVYAVGLVLVIQWLPLPSESAAEGEIWLGALFAEHAQNLVGAGIGLFFIVVYWIRSNTLLSALDRTDTGHTALSIASLFSLLFLLYVVRVSDEVAAPSHRAGQSLAIALIGITAGLAWWRAGRKGLLRDGIGPTSHERLAVQAYAEPLAALVTLPLAYVGDLAWDLSWLIYIPISIALRSRQRRRLGAGKDRAA